MDFPCYSQRLTGITCDSNYITTSPLSRRTAGYWWPLPKHLDIPRLQLKTDKFLFGQFDKNDSSHMLKIRRPWLQHDSFFSSTWIWKRTRNTLSREESSSLRRETKPKSLTETVLSHTWRRVRIIFWLLSDCFLCSFTSCDSSNSWLPDGWFVPCLFFFQGKLLNSFHPSGIYFLCGNRVLLEITAIRQKQNTFSINMLGKCCSVYQ